MTNNRTNYLVSSKTISYLRDPRYTSINTMGNEMGDATRRWIVAYTTRHDEVMNKNRMNFAPRVNQRCRARGRSVTFGIYIGNLAGSASWWVARTSRAWTLSGGEVVVWWWCWWSAEFQRKRGVDMNKCWIALEDVHLFSIKRDFGMTQKTKWLSG